MMRSLLPLRKEAVYASVAWHESRSIKDVKFAVRRPSLAQRIELTAQVRELMLKHEFLRAGDTADQLTASLSDLLVTKLYVEWGLAEVTGLVIDGEPATAKTLIEFGPETLVDEIVAEIRAESGLTEDERKNF